MFFNVSEDLGTIVQGYLVPDGFSEQGEILVFDGDTLVFQGLCDRPVPSLVTSGRHSTGLVGFLLDDNNVPGIQYIRNLRIADAKTKMQIYQRFLVEEHLAHKFIRVDTQLLPHRDIDRFFENKFQYYRKGINLLSHETAIQMFELLCGVSIYVSGRILLRSFESYLDRDFKSAILINDPYYEFAERLFILSRFKSISTKLLSERDQFGMYNAIEYFENLDLDDPTEIKRAVTKAPKIVLEILESPLTRQLVTTRHDEKIDRRAVSAALDMLSRIDIVSLAREPEDYSASICSVLGVPHETIKVPQQHERIRNLADVLREIHLAEIILEKDLILYHFLEKSIQSAKLEEV